MKLLERGYAYGLVLALAFAAPASAQNLDLDELGALLVLPYITGNHPGDVVITGQTAVTLNTITNASSESILLAIDFINGDPGEVWGSTSRTCELTGSETTTFVFEPRPGGSRVYFECSRGGDLAGAGSGALTLSGENGVMVVAVADENGPIAPPAIQVTNVLVGDSVVVDLSGGQAYSVAAIPVQAGFGLKNTDKAYVFDGQEYMHFPSVLTSNFITPVPPTPELMASVNAELILFTLDGTLGSTPAPRARVAGFGYDDDEQAFDFQYEFQCFDIVALDEVNPNFVNLPNGGPGLGTLSGHLELFVGITANNNSVHDDRWGDGNDTRRSLVHGWIVQNVTPGAYVVREGQPTAGQNQDRELTGATPAAWGRPLNQGTGPLVPFGGDTPALDAR